MKRLFLQLVMIGFLVVSAKAQETVYPAPAQKETVYIVNATIHVGNGQVIENGTVKIANGKIAAVGAGNNAGSDGKVVDAKGQHVYPGLILPSSQLGLVEVPPVRATVDSRELGDINPSIRSIVAYNTDSKVINTLKSNGILLANVYPDGGIIPGSSTVVQLDAWNWEDAAYAMDNGIHYNMPSLLTRRGGGRGFGFGAAQPAGDPIKRALDDIEESKVFFREAKAYAAEATHAATNLKFEAVKGLFSKKQKLYIHCNIVKEILVAVDFVKEFGFDVVIVGGSDSWLVTDVLKQYNISVILGQMHDLPNMVDDDVDQPFKTPSILQKAGVLYAIGDEDGNTRSRNLAFNAGTAAAYGLTKEEALTAITLNAAKILGIADKTGSIEVGKDANIVISVGDILDMKSSVITAAFIQGRAVDLTDKHKQLKARYEHKYGIN
ncbi:MULTISPECIES: amidohydrolase family protein [unclassified Paraflavitalea]|uniref:amidohydrolase family protein n=1 Tax=unclassified Paraflavitalea TaxID=2798305 RepID=UPI003D34171F